MGLRVSKRCFLPYTTWLIMYSRITQERSTGCKNTSIRMPLYYFGPPFGGSTFAHECKLCGARYVPLPCPPASLLPALMASHYLPALSPPRRSIRPLDRWIRSTLPCVPWSLFLLRPHPTHLPPQGERAVEWGIIPPSIYRAPQCLRRRHGRYLAQVTAATPNVFLPPGPERASGRTGEQRAKTALPPSALAHSLPSPLPTISFCPFLLSPGIQSLCCRYPF